LLGALCAEELQGLSGMRNKPT